MFVCPVLGLVYTACFGRRLDPRYEEIIQSFRTNYEDLRAYALDHLKQKVQCTWKVHILFCHVVQWLREHPVGLGCYAEQTLEACHHSFNKTLKRHSVSESHPKHQARLRRSVVKYNSKRV